MDAALTRDTLAPPARRGKRRARRIRNPARPASTARCQSRDIDALETLAETRQASVIKLLKIEEERRSALRHARLRHRPAGLAKLIAWCDPTPFAGQALRRMRHARAPMPRPQRSQWRAGRRTDQARRRPAGRASPARSAEPRGYGPRGQSQPLFAPPETCYPPRLEAPRFIHRLLPEKRATARFFLRPQLSNYLVPRGAPSAQIDVMLRARVNRVALVSKGITSNNCT